MPTLNLKEYYPTAHSKDFFVEVSEDIHQFFYMRSAKKTLLLDRSVVTMRITRWTTRIL